MGAVGIEFQVVGNKDDVKKAFRDRKKSDKKKFKNLYMAHILCGEFLTVKSLHFGPNKPFNTVADAREFCLEHAEKWDYVLAVKISVNKRTKKSHWLVAGWGAE